MFGSVKAMKHCKRFWMPRKTKAQDKKMEDMVS